MANIDRQSKSIFGGLLDKAPHLLITMLSSAHLLELITGQVL